MGPLHHVGEADGWRCWLCDEPVDPDLSPNDPRGASLDTRISKGRAKKKNRSRAICRPSDWNARVAAKRWLVAQNGKLPTRLPKGSSSGSHVFRLGWKYAQKSQPRAANSCSACRQCKRPNVAFETNIITPWAIVSRLPRI